MSHPPETPREELLNIVAQMRTHAMAAGEASMEERDDALRDQLERHALLLTTACDALERIASTLTDRERHAQEIAALRAELEAVRQAVRQFLAVHEARWPHILSALMLTAVRAGNRGVDPCPDQPSYIDAVSALRSALSAPSTPEPAPQEPT